MGEAMISGHSVAVCLSCAKVTSRQFDWGEPSAQSDVVETPASSCASGVVVAKKPFEAPVLTVLTSDGERPVTGAPLRWVPARGDCYR